MYMDLVIFEQLELWFKDGIELDTIIGNGFYYEIVGNDNLHVLLQSLYRASLENEHEGNSDALFESVLNDLRQHTI